MALISFSAYRESSPATRNKSAAANGLVPMSSADVFGHVTPPPAITKKLLKKLEHKPKKNKEEEEIKENKGQSPNYSFDQFIKKAASTSKEVEKELIDGKKEFDKLDNMKQKEKEDKKPVFPKKMIQSSPFPKNQEEDDFKDKEEIPGEKLPSEDDKDEDDEDEKQNKEKPEKVNIKK